MLEPHKELLEIADDLDRITNQSGDDTIAKPLDTLLRATEKFGRAASGSWLGYHANVYYEGFQPPPPGAHFSQEWGLMDLNFDSLGSRGAWREYTNEAVEAAIYEQAGNPDLTSARKFNSEAGRKFDTYKSQVLSILETESTDSSDSFLSRLISEATKLTTLSTSEVAEHFNPKGKALTRDTTALSQGAKIPPHMAVYSEIRAIQHTIGIIQKLATYSRQAGSHLARKQNRRKKSERIGTNVFVGHGRSLLWRELKDFIEDRLKLPVDEFNRVPVAGIANVARLSEMLDAAAIAFIVMTGEDEQVDNKLHARLNVVHEAGMFQGRLGFERAIVVLENGCEEFSNIAGLGQIRFPKGDIKAAFEEIRQVLEREGII